MFYNIMCCSIFFKMERCSFCIYQDAKLTGFEMLVSQENSFATERINNVQKADLYPLE